MAKSKRKKGNAGKVVIAVIAIAALCIGGKYAYDKAQIKKDGVLGWTYLNNLRTLND